MSFGKNLQFLRKMRGGMTQEELAEKMLVSRQTISKWELEAAYPEIGKAVELCQLFSCSLDGLFRDDMNTCDEAYSNIRTEKVNGFQYVSYAVISTEPEEDAIYHVNGWAKRQGIKQPQIIGWDFPAVSQEQINVHHMHGYTAALILPPDFIWKEEGVPLLSQKAQQYAAITIKEPFKGPFRVIPNAYKTLMAYMKVNGLEHQEEKGVIPCYEREYQKEGTCYMDVYIAILL